jgi:glutathione-specific gamma-glutamylcyclotransferase
LPVAARRVMALTPELVARAARVVEDAGPSPGAVYLADADYDELVADALSRMQGELWIFGFGSLLWKPAFTFVEERMATVHGWHRAFCLWVVRWRGTRDRPGLMMALDRGGTCRGKVFRVAPAEAEATLHTLFRREVVVKPSSQPPRWLRAETAGGPLPALGFAIDRRSPHYSGRLPLEEVVEVMATAAGHWGSCAEYLHNTVASLEATGIHDRSLWRLQARVAARLLRSEPDRVDWHTDLRSW